MTWTRFSALTPGCSQLTASSIPSSVSSTLRVSSARFSASSFTSRYTHPGATPRDAQNNPTGPLKELEAMGTTRFLDLEFKRGGFDPVADDLEKVCLARLIQAGVDDYFTLASLPLAVQKLVGLLPARGDLGVAQRSGFQQLRDWRKDTAVKPALAAFPVGAALRLVDQHKLLNDWTTTKRIEFRHRDFVQEIGKELLLP